MSRNIWNPAIKETHQSWSQASIRTQLSSKETNQKKATMQSKGFFDLINGAGQDPNKNPPSEITILDITQTTAVTKTVMVFHGQAYVDYHAFVKTPKGWKITAKIYHTIQ